MGDRRSHVSEWVSECEREEKDENIPGDHMCVRVNVGRWKKMEERKHHLV